MGSSNSTQSERPVISVEKLSQADATAIRRMQQSLHQRSYAILSLDSGPQHQAIHTVEAQTKAFFRDAADSEKGQLESELENLGYIRGSTREFLKYRRPDIPWLVERSNVLTEQEAVAVCDTMEEIGWKCMMGLIGQCNPLQLKEDDFQDLRECIHERASVSSIHYFAAQQSEPREKPATIPENHFEVCAEHQDTGIFTLVLTSGVAGLEIYDTHLEQWLRVEEEIQPLRSESRDIMVLMMGHKAPLWFGEEYLPTIHRVIIPQGQERPSFLYFMDTAKI